MSLRWIRRVFLQVVKNLYYIQLITYWAILSGVSCLSQVERLKVMMVHACVVSVEYHDLFSECPLSTETL